MSIFEPPDDQDDEMWAFLEEEMAELDKNLQGYEHMFDQDLISERTRIQSRLRALGEVIKPKTEEGRELHSKWGAILHELQKRGLRGK